MPVVPDIVLHFALAIGATFVLNEIAFRLYWRSKSHPIRRAGLSPDEEKAERGAARMVGAIETILYPVAVLADFPTIIAAWLVLKGIAQFRVESNTIKYHHFVFGNGLSLLCGLAGAGLALLALPA